MSKTVIVKNTVFLYFRTLIILLISLYTARVLLDEIGVEDYGIYNLVGGIILVFSSVKSLFTSSIQRFLNYEMGSKDSKKKERLQDIFSHGVIIHIIICLFVLILAETVGLWFVNNKLVFDANRLIAVNYVYQFSVLSTIVAIMTIPYDAVLIAYEKMNIYAYISILDAILRLVIVYAISFYEGDKLILYGLLVLTALIIIRSVSSYYCNMKFSICNFKFKINISLLKELGAFAGWNFLGNTTYTIVNEGINFLLNIFGGPVANAARSISYQIRAAISLLASNIQTAIAPSMTQLYVKSEKERVFNIIYIASKMSFLFSLFISIPLLVFTERFLHIWLVDVPEHTEYFVQLIIIYLLVRSFHGSIDALFKSSGKMKLYQIIDSMTLVLTLPCSYFFLKEGGELHIVFIVMIYVEIINWFSLLFLAMKREGFILKKYANKVLFPCFLVLAVSFICIYIVDFIFPEIARCIFLFLVFYIIIELIIIYLLGLSKIEKIYVKQHIQKKLSIG